MTLHHEINIWNVFRFDSDDDIWDYINKETEISSYSAKVDSFYLQSEASAILKLQNDTLL